MTTTSRLIDSHCHLDDDRFDKDREAVIDRARRAGVNRFVVPAICREGWDALRQLGLQHESIAPAFGLHPWFCDRHRDSDLKALPDYLGGAVAVGECGLDQGLCRFDLDEQLHWLRAQLRIAADSNLPLIIHAYKTVDILMSEIKRFAGLRGVVHSFAGSLQQADKLIDMGFYIGIGGAVTQDRAKKVQEVVRTIPLQRLLLETDAPDQSPAGHQGDRNEPSFLVEILERVATLRGMDAGEVAGICNDNARELFNL